MKNNILLTNLRMRSPQGLNIYPVSICIADGRIDKITAPGSKSLHTRTSDRVMDLNGCWVSPGFTDSHFHLLSYSKSLEFLQLESMNRDQIRAVVQQTSQTAYPGTWIRGRGWEAFHWQGPGQPSKSDLDPVSQFNPVALTSKDGHTLLLNSKAMEILNFDRCFPDPPGGSFDRNPETGELTGILRENAIVDAIKRIPQPSDQKYRELLSKSFKILHSFGITAVHGFEDLKTFRLLKDLDENGELPLRIYLYIKDDDLDEAIELQMKTGQGSSFLRFGGIKLFADGALGSKTALMKHPYQDDADNFGVEVTSLIELNCIAETAAQHGIASAIHAIGDQAVSNALTALIKARETAPNLNGLRIEHIQLISHEEIKQFSKYQITASVQPYHALSDINIVNAYWPDMPGLKYPCKSLKDHNVHMVFGSDAPIDNLNPLDIISAAMRSGHEMPATHQDIRWYSDERLDLESAVQACTSNPAVLEGTGTQRGSLQEGQFADLVILDGDPFETRQEDLCQHRVVMTIVSGEIVYNILNDR